MAAFYFYNAQVTRVIDGDTFEAEVDLGFRLKLGVTVRLYGLNCPELHGATKEAGLAAKARVEQLTAGQRILLESWKLDKYGRSVARVQLPDGRHLTDVLLAEGHGVAYLGMTEEE